MAGEGRKEEPGSQKSKDDEGGSVRLAKNPYIIVRGILEAGHNLPDVSKAHLAMAFILTSQVTCLRESCMRENRTCSLGGGRRPARKRASSDPTIRFLPVCPSLVWRPLLAVSPAAVTPTAAQDLGIPAARRGEALSKGCG
jgi:hypothetical protein